MANEHRYRLLNEDGRTLLEYPQSLPTDWSLKLEATTFPSKTVRRVKYDVILYEDLPMHTADSFSFVTFIATREKKANEKVFPQSFVIRLPNALKGDDERRRSFRRAALLNEIDALLRLENVDSPLAPKLMAPQPNEGHPSNLKTIEGWLHEMPIAGSNDVISFAPRRFLIGNTVRQWYTEQKRRNEAFQIDLSSWLMYAEEVTNNLRRIHKERVTHGYLSPDNVIVEGLGVKQLKSPRFVNFEKTFYFGKEAAREQPGKASLWRRPFDSPEKRFLKEGEFIVSARTNQNADWFTAADIFSLGLHLLYLITGQAALPSPWAAEETVGGKALKDKTISDENCTWKNITDDRPKSHVLYKREIFGLIKERYLAKKGGQLKKAELEKCVAVAEILFAYLRIGLSSRLTDLDQVLDTIYHFGPSIKRGFKKTWPKAKKRATAKALGKLSNELKLEIPTLLENAGLSCAPVQRLMRARVEKFVGDLSEEEPFLTIRGGRAQMIDSMLTLISSLGKGWAIDAVTGATFWFRDNMAIGRFASKLMVAPLQGCRVRWRLLLRERDLNHLEVASTMRGLKYIDKEVRKYLTHRDADHWDIKWMAQPDDSYDEFARLRKSFICIRKRDDHKFKDAVFVAPDYQLDGGTLTVLRLWKQSDRFKELFEEFYSAKDKGFRPIDRFPQRPPDPREW